MKIVNAVGARPNFVKMAAIIQELRKHGNLEWLLVHTGQHYGLEMSETFFAELDLPQPDVHLGVGEGSHGEQTGRMMIEFEKVLVKESPDLLIVVGDVNSTLACALAASKLKIPIAHVEAGLRSFDRCMPEEVNRLLTDAVSDYLFVTEQSGEENLLREGISPERIFFVGNVMIDTLFRFRDRIAQSTILSRLGLEPSQYLVLTLHRPENVDIRQTFAGLLAALDEVSRRIRIVYPAHPRTRRRIDEFALQRDFPFLSEKERFLLLEPLSYLDFLKLVSESSLVLTDSGGVQEETTALSTPCLTLRERTERPVTVAEGTNRVVGTTPQKVVEESLDVLDGHQKVGRMPRLWDGKAAERIVKIILENRERTVRKSHGRAFLFHQ